jgi:hypothetical protein
MCFVSFFWCVNGKWLQRRLPVQPLIFSFYFYFTKWHITNAHIFEGGYVLVGV